MFAAAGAVLLTAAGRLYFGVMTSDDAFITYRYARHLADTHALVYNAGERVLGTSTPLYALVMTTIAALGLPMEATSLAIGTGCDAAAAFVLYLLMADAGMPMAGVAAAALAGSVPLGIVPASAGMETPLYVLLVLATFRQGARALATGRTALLSVLVILVGLCRPDGALAIAAVLGGLAIADWRLAWRALRPALAAAAGIAALTWWYYGSIVPQSVVAKSAAVDPPGAGVRVFGRLMVERLHLVTTVLGLIGAAVLWRAALVWRWLFVWWIAYAVAFSVTNAFLHGDWYFVPLQAGYWAAVAAGVDYTASVALRERWARRVALLLNVLLVAAAVRGWPGHRAAFAHVQAIRERPYLEVGSRLARSDRPCNLAAPEIGALGFAFPGRIIDLGGLVTPAAVNRPALAVLEEQDAQWLVARNTDMPPGLAGDAGFTRRFAPVDSIPLDAGRTLDVYERRDGGCRR